MNPIPLLINPAARSAHGQGLRRWLQNHRHEFCLYEPQTPEAMQQQCTELTHSGVEMVAVAGGDGTLSRVLPSFLGTETTLAVIPSGTVNVFAREIGIGSHNYDAALRAIKKGKNYAIDIFQINGVPFLQMAGVGPDARAVELTTSKLKSYVGAMAYGIAGLKTLSEPWHEFIFTQTDGRILKGKAMIMGNGGLYGGSARLFKEADYSDELLDVVVFHQSCSSMVYHLVKAALFGGLCPQEDGKYFSYHQVKGGCISSAQRMPIQMDGDFFGELSSSAPAMITRSLHKLRIQTLIG